MVQLRDETLGGEHELPPVGQVGWMDAARTTPGVRIDVPSVPNLRDIGGYPVAGGGRVKTGELYRSVELNHLHGDGDLAAMARLGLRRSSTAPRARTGPAGRPPRPCCSTGSRGRMCSATTC